MSVSAHASPPFAAIRWICAGCGRPPLSPAGERRNASHCPSGDQRGEASRLPEPKRRGSPPLVLTVKSEVS
jgi:hypothetical protein